MSKELSRSWPYINASHQPMCVEKVKNINILIFYYISINLDEDYTLDNDEHDIIDIDVDLM